MNAQELWNKTLNELRFQMSASTFDLWLGHAQLLTSHDDALTVEVPSQLVKDWLESHLLFSIRRLLLKISGHPFEVQFVTPSAPEAPDLGAASEPHVSSGRKVDWRAFNLPPIFEQATLDTLDLSAASLQKPELLNYIRQPIQYLQAGTGLTLIGPAGVGKTHVAIGIFKQAVEAGWTASYLDVDELADQLSGGKSASRKQWRGRRMAQLQSELLEVQLLVLDDLNPASLTAEVSQLISKVIKRRWNHRRPLIATTNYLLDDLARPTAPGTIALEDAALSRLTSGTLVLSLHGFDFRVLIKKQNLRRAGITREGTAHE